MSEIADYQKIYLGETEQIFIFLFAMRSFSASELFSHLKNQKKMSYKNVFTKIQRLVELGILEAVEGRFKRDATTRGLFQVTSDKKGESLSSQNGNIQALPSSPRKKESRSSLYSSGGR